MTSAGPARRRVFFAGGGTGGHLYPGLAIARALVRADATIEPFFIGARRGIERDILPTTEFAHRLLELHPLYRRTPWNNWKTVAGGVSAMRELGALARETRPLGVIGTGGYAAGMALLWARLNGTRTFLHEPDSHPGLTTRAFAPGADAVFLGFPEAAARLRTRAGHPVLALGCPIEPPPAQREARASALARWGFPADAFVVLVFGGSQGARALNDAVAAWCRAGLPDGVSLIWGTGKSQYEPYAALESERVRVRPYLAPITEAYAASDLAITRAGAMTIAELTAWGVPSVLVPLPTAAQDHQTHNAVATAAAGAAVHLPQRDLTTDALGALARSLREGSRLDDMRAAALARARPTAAADIAAELLGMLGRP